MTVRFVSAVDGNNANGGTSWADAKQTVAGALAISAAGDFIKVDSAGTFTATAAITWTPPAGAIAIVSVNRAGSDAWLAGATEAVGAASNNFIVANAAAAAIFLYGMTLQGGTNNNAACVIVLGNPGAVSMSLDAWSCTFELPSASASTTITFGNSAGGTRVLRSTYRDCTFKCSGSRAGTFIRAATGIFELINPTISLTGGTKPAILFNQSSTSEHATLVIRDGDLSGYAVSSGALFDVSTFVTMNVTMKNLKTSATPTLTTGAWPAASMGNILQRNVDSGNTLYVFQYNNAYGTLTESISIYAANGALFNAAGSSWQVVTTAVASESFPFMLPILRRWNSVTTSQTVIVEFDKDGATNLTDRDLWMDLSYPASASFPNYSNDKSARNANPFIGTAADQPASSVSWTGTGGFAAENKQKLNVTFTAAAAGLIEAHISIAKASTTLYIDPKLKIANDSSATRWLDDGAMQEVAAAGGSSMLVHAGMVGGMRG